MLTARLSGGRVKSQKQTRVKPPSVRVSDKRKILKAVPKLRKIKPAKPGK